MRKYGFFLLVFFFGFCFPKAAEAQTFGYNIVNNFYNPDGSFDDQAFELLKNGSVTIRLVMRELESHLRLIEDIETAANKYNLQIIWQPEDWHATSASEFRTNWLPYLSQINTGTLSLFTEYNYFNGNPSEYAQILQEALNAGLNVPIGTTNFNTTNPNGSNPFGGSMMEYMQFLREVNSHCSGCLNQIPVWSVSIYGNYSGGDMSGAVSDFINQFNNFKNNLASLGINLAGKTFIIPEAGLDPSIPIGERLNKAREFAQKLEASGIDASTITFLFMDDKTGKQYFMYKDEDGNWIIAEYETFNLVGLTGPGGKGDDYGQSMGEAFEIRGKGKEDIEARVREIMLKDFEVGDINLIGYSSARVIEKILPPGEEDQTREQSSQGYIEFFYCKVKDEQWPDKLSEERLWFETPRYYQQMATATYQTGDFLSLPGQNISHPLAVGRSKETNLAQKKEGSKGVVLLAPGETPFYFILDSSSFCDRSGCTISINGSERSGHMWVEANGQFLGINSVPGPGAAPNTYYYKFPSSGPHPVNLKVVNYDYGKTGDYNADHPTTISSCSIEAGERSCSFSGAQSVPAPSPPECKIENYYLGEEMRSQGVAFGGKVTIPFALGWPEKIYNAATTFYEDIFKHHTFVIIPVIHTPWTNAAEAIYRNRVALPYTLSGDSHLYKPAQVDVDYRDNKEEDYQKKGSIYGVKGEDESYNYIYDILSPPGW